MLSTVGSTRAFPPHHPLIPVDYQFIGTDFCYNRIDAVTEIFDNWNDISDINTQYHDT